jgi:hypothetical protein
MAGIFSRLIDFMEEEGWKYEILEGETVLRFHFKASAGRFHFYANVEEDKNWLIFYSYLPVNTPPEKINAMAEFITRANRGMPIGNFELDFEDGEIRYKTSIDVEGGELVNKMIDNLLRANLSTMNRYFTSMMELIYGDKSPRELIQKVEGVDDLEPGQDLLPGDDTEGSDDIEDEGPLREQSTDSISSTPPDDFGDTEYHIEEGNDDEDDDEGDDKRRRRR